MRTTLHRARTAHPCDSYPCDRAIEAGDVYVRHVAFPGEEGHEEGTGPWVIRECEPCVEKYSQWVRDHYGVPAHLGVKVVFDSKPGVIVGLHGGQVHVRLDLGRTVPVHPTWRMEYAEMAGAE